jgi:hypothetical protein
MSRSSIRRVGKPAATDTSVVHDAEIANDGLLRGK